MLQIVYSSRFKVYLISRVSIILLWLSIGRTTFETVWDCNDSSGDKYAANLARYWINKILQLSCWAPIEWLRSMIMPVLGFLFVFCQVILTDKYWLTWHSISVTVITDDYKKDYEDSLLQFARPVMMMVLGCRTTASVFLTKQWSADTLVGTW